MSKSNSPVALITGVTGQDGSYLAEFLLDKGYTVHGLRRRSSSFNSSRIEHLYQDPRETSSPMLLLHYGDMTDATNLIRIVQAIQPDEIYNLAAQSHVQVSFESPEYTANADGLGTLRILEAIRILGLSDKTRFYQASTSEIFGGTSRDPCNEKSGLYPKSPYGVAKAYAHWITINYREAHDLFAVNGILFNHESPRRGETFVTRKITRALTRIRSGLQEKLFVGNLEASRDWGHARDYVEAMWLMLQHPQPEDFVIATGHTCSVRDFIEKVCAELEVRLDWQGNGLEEKGIDASSGKAIVEIDELHFRPTEVNFLLGDSSKARRVLGWKPAYSVDDLVTEMVNEDLALAEMELRSKAR